MAQPLSWLGIQPEWRGWVILVLSVASDSPTSEVAWTRMSWGYTEDKGAKPSEAGLSCVALILFFSGCRKL